ncbi:cytochrome P450 [Xylariaceae sp. FL0594]|nr:cytochrome P450 [Xylariaceae sp. FL0594]
MTASVTGVTATSDQISNVDPLGDHGFVHGLTQKIRAGVNPGPKLDALNRKSVQLIATSLAKFGKEQKTFSVNLKDWVYHEVMMATTGGVYGPRNPFEHEEMRKAFPRYERDFLPLMINILPSWIAPDGVRARTVLERGYQRYFDEGGHTEAESSTLIKEKYEFCTAKGLPDLDIAKVEVLASIALLSNTMPATFWLAYHLYSDEELLSACRMELEQAVSETGDNVRTIDMACVKNRCPILLSTFQEVLRFYAVGVSSRRVLEDTVIDNTYLVKKGGIIFIPGVAQHKLKSAWGEGADEFSPKRFVPNPAGSGKSRNYDAAAFRAFGGGATLCPGRHFVATEILAFAAFIVLRFDAQPTEGKWTPPTTQKTVPAATIRQPDYGFDVELRARNNYEWEVQFSDLDVPIPVSIEDIVST